MRKLRIHKTVYSYKCHSNVFNQNPDNINRLRKEYQSIYFCNFCKHCSLISVSVHIYFAMASCKQLWDILLNILCFLGCAYQLQNVILSYFEYGSIVRYRLLTPEFVVFLDLHVCFLAMEDVLNVSAIKQKYSIKLGDRNDNEVFKLMDIITKESKRCSKQVIEYRKRNTFYSFLSLAGSRLH